MSAALQLVSTIDRADLTDRAVSACLQGLSGASRRVYASHLQRYITWSAGAALSRETVRAYIRALELQGASAQVRNQALAAVKRFASECAELTWIDHATAVQIQKIKSAHVRGTRTGRWLTVSQLLTLLQLPDIHTVRGRRDACVLALLAGCGLRRAEACSLQTEQIRTIEGRMYLTNVSGKGARVRTIAVPRWAQRSIEQWKEEVEAQC